MGRNKAPSRGSARVCIPLLLSAAFALLFAALAANRQPLAGESAETPAAPEVQGIPIVLARQRRDLPPPLSLLDVPPQDDGIAGATLAVNDNNTTGRFLK